MIRKRASVLLAVALAVAHAGDAAAQFAEPCELTCIGVFAATGFVTATGASVAAGRISGGMSTINQGLLVWGGTFVALTGSGMALSGDGHRQERAVYSAGLGVLAGALTGLAVEALRTGGDEPRVLAGALMGAAVGAIAGGVYGALSYDGADLAGPTPLLSVSIPF